MLPPPSPTPDRRPLVSCLTITEERFDFLTRAIRCFADQTWPEKEMVIVSQGTDAYKQRITEHLATLGRSDIRTVFVEPGHTLGALRNRSLDAMRGEILAVWDDDDVSHPDRLTVQVEAMLAHGTRVCFLGDRLQWFVEDGVAFWTSNRTNPKSRHPCINTVVAYREPDSRYPEHGPFAWNGEDFGFVMPLLGRAPHSVIGGRAELFVYTMHGSNTYAMLNHVHLARMRAVPVADWPRPRAEALAALERLGISARPAGPDEAHRIWQREAAKADPIKLRRIQGVLAVLAGDFDEARRQLAPEVVRGDPKSCLEIGRLDLRADRLRDAERAFREALALEPSFPEAWESLGEALLRLERFTEAEHAFRQGTSLGATGANCTAGLGLALARQGRLPEAVDALRDAVIRAPNVDRMHNLLIAGMRDAGMGAALASTYDQLSTLRPHASRLHVRRGEIAAEAGDGAGALRSWQRASALDPNDPEPHLLAGDQALREGHPWVAAERLRRAIAVRPNDPRAHARLGAALRDAGDPAGAIGVLEHALTLDRTSIYAWMELAHARAAVGDPAAALGAVERVLVQQPGLEPARILRDRLKQAVASAGRASRADPWTRLDARWGLPPAPTGERPVFLLAAGWRSGSTLLQRLVASSGEVFVWGEPYGHATLVPALVERTRAFDDQWPPAEDIAPEGPVAFSEAWVANLAPHPSALKTSLRALVDGLYATPARGRAPRWGLKEVRFGADEARLLRWLYPDARFVFVVRNPWAAWSSYAGRRWHVRWPDPPVETPDAFASLWTRIAGDFLSWPFDDALLIRHEDIVGADPPLARLAAHLGVARIDRSALDAKVRGGLPEPRSLDASAVAAIEAIAGPTARRLGYDGPLRAVVRPSGDTR